MDPHLKAALSASSFDSDYRTALLHADLRIRKFIWGGFRPTKFTDGSELTVAGLSAEDFVTLALERLISGVRAYASDKTFVQNINRTVDSIIWSAKKASDREPTVCHQLEWDENGKPIDPISNAEDWDSAPDDLLVSEELEVEHRKLIEAFQNRFDGDEFIQNCIEVMGAEMTDKEAAEYLGVPVEEYRATRKILRKEAKSFFNAKTYQELERKIQGQQ